MNWRPKLITALVVSLILSISNIFLIPTQSVPEKIVKSIVRVNDASGVVIDSDESSALVLTAYHVIEEHFDEDGKSLLVMLPILVQHSYFFDVDGKALRIIMPFSVLSVHKDPKKDLALLEISTNIKLNSVKLAVDLPKLAEEVYIAGNPNNNYQSISKGIISNRSRHKDGVWLWQISGGLTFGHSGGGAFNEDGELVAIAKSIDMYSTGFCRAKTDEEETIEDRCLMFPIYDMGFFVTPYDIRGFLLTTKFKNKFKYIGENNE